MIYIPQGWRNRTDSRFQLLPGCRQRLFFSCGMCCHWGFRFSLDTERFLWSYQSICSETGSAESVWSWRCVLSPVFPLLSPPTFFQVSVLITPPSWFNTREWIFLIWGQIWDFWGWIIDAFQYSSKNGFFPEARFVGNSWSLASCAIFAFRFTKICWITDAISLSYFPKCISLCFSPFTHSRQLVWKSASLQTHLASTVTHLVKTFKRAFTLSPGAERVGKRWEN